MPYVLMCSKKMRDTRDENKFDININSNKCLDIIKSLIHRLYKYNRTMQQKTIFNL